MAHTERAIHLDIEGLKCQRVPRALGSLELESAAAERRQMPTVGGAPDALPEARAKCGSTLDVRLGAHEPT